MVGGGPRPPPPPQLCQRCSESSRLLGGHSHDRVSDTHRAGGGRGDLAELLLVRHDHRGDRVVAGLADDIPVNLGQDVAALDDVTLGDARREALTLQLHGIHADVDEHLDAGRGLDAVGVARRERNRHLAVTRSNNHGTSGRGDGDASSLNAGAASATGAAAGAAAGASSSRRDFFARTSAFCSFVR